MNFKEVREHQEHEEPEHIAEDLTVFQSVLKDDKLLSKSSIQLPDVAYIKHIDGICPQTVIKDHWMEGTNNEPMLCKEHKCTELFIDPVELINHIQESHTDIQI